MKNNNNNEDVLSIVFYENADTQKIAIGSVKTLLILVINIKSEVMEFISIRKVSKYIGKHHSYITKCLKRYGFYKGELSTVKIK